MFGEFSITGSSSTQVFGQTVSRNGMLHGWSLVDRQPLLHLGAHKGPENVQHNIDMDGRVAEFQSLRTAAVVLPGLHGSLDEWRSQLQRVAQLNFVHIEDGGHSVNRDRFVGFQDQVQDHFADLEDVVLAVLAGIVCGGSDDHHQPVLLVLLEQRQETAQPQNFVHFAEIGISLREPFGAFGAHFVEAAREGVWL